MTEQVQQETDSLAQLQLMIEGRFAPPKGSSWVLSLSRRSPDTLWVRCVVYGVGADNRRAGFSHVYDKHSTDSRVSLEYQYAEFRNRVDDLLQYVAETPKQRHGPAI